MKTRYSFVTSVLTSELYREFNGQQRKAIWNSTWYDVVLPGVYSTSK